MLYDIAFLRGVWMCVWVVVSLFCDVWVSDRGWGWGWVDWILGFIVGGSRGFFGGFIIII